MNHKPFRKAAAAIGITAIAFLGMGAPAASAAPIITDGQTTDLVIHKYLGPVQSPLLPNDGNAVTGITADPLSGIQFDVYKVSQWLDTMGTPDATDDVWKNVDLTTNAGWEQAASVYGCMVTAAMIPGPITCGGIQYKLTLATSGETVGGAATFEDQAVGLYLVAENLADSSYTSASSLSPAAPFFVTLPMTDTDGLDGVAGNTDDRMNWLDTVHVYPKNQQDSITKTVSDGNLGVANQDGYYIGQNLTYTLKSSITATDSNGDGLVDGTDLGYYYVGDQLSTDVNFVSVVSSLVDAAGLPLDPAVSLTRCAAADLSATCDYYYSVVEETTTAPITGDWVRVVFTTAGLDKLAAHSGSFVKTEIVVTLDSLPADGIVPNMADFIPSQAWWMGQGNTTPLTPGTDTTPGTTPTTPDNIPSDPVLSKYGNVTITKAAQDGTTLLGGAEFTIYRDIDNSDTCTDLDVQGGTVSGTTYTATKIGLPVTTDASPFLTDGTTPNPNLGKVTFVGLLTSDFYNNAPQTGTAQITYCLVETKAPDGYNLLADPIPFKVMSEYATDSTTPVLSIHEMPVVKNMLSNLNNNLPLTGGEGIAALSLGGLALIGGGAGYYAYTSRKRRTA